MKLYFHFLDTDVVGGVRVEECEVDKKPKSYVASTIFPEGYTDRLVRKTEIGAVIGRLNPVVVQYKQDEDHARNLFMRKIIKKINILDNESTRLEKIYSILSKK